MAYSWLGSSVTGQVQGDGRDFMALAVLHNDRFSSHKVIVRRAMMQCDMTGIVIASGTLFTPALTYRGVGNPIIGSQVAYAKKSSWDTSQMSDDRVKLYYPATGGGISDSILSGTPSGGIVWRQWGTKLRTGVEQLRAEDNNQLPLLVDATNFVLLPGQYLLFRLDPVIAMTGPLTGDNNPGLGWFINVAWQEEALPTHTISGVVTSDAIGVVGAKVTILLDDNTSLSNPELWETVTTEVGGAWTSSAIPDGKIAYAYAQNFTDGTYYSATGAPYVS